MNGLVADDILALLKTAHRNQLALCDCLETIADSLPDAIDRAKCVGTARALGPLIAGTHALEENVLFPALANIRRAGIDMTATIERMKFEHLEDACFAEELHDALMAYGSGEDTPNPEAFGYMLRGFFDSLRRHVAFETEIILPLAGYSSVSRIAPKDDRDRG